jgi:hypothetical protein
MQINSTVQELCTSVCWSIWLRSSQNELNRLGDSGHNSSFSEIFAGTIDLLPCNIVVAQSDVHRKRPPARHVHAPEQNEPKLGCICMYICIYKHIQEYCRKRYIMDCHGYMMDIYIYQCIHILKKDTKQRQWDIILVYYIKIPINWTPNHTGFLSYQIWLCLGTSMALST